MESTEKRQKNVSKTLRVLNKKEHLPQGLIRLFTKILALQLEAHTHVSVDFSGFDFPSLCRSVGQGGSCLSPQNFPLDNKNGVALFFRIVALITDPAEEIPEPIVRAAGEVARGIETKTLDLEQAFRESLSGEGPIHTAWAQRTPEAPGILRFLMLASLEPSLHAVEQILGDHLHGDGKVSVIRQTGTCPICGNLPYILELRGKEGVRFALCSLCRHEYRIRRLACPVCDSNDFDKIAYFTVEEEPGFRVETCESCNTYMKTIDFRGLDRQACPEFNDLESMALDYLAAKQGLKRSTLSVWGI
ncbi:formate dehydrogenase accessory protein FdhE [Desulfoluna sp.]|uniref:formate dehydrogenase accessory protein FdhE n=1 Tax=Desulfoluna sp. TaxID=2045199 RepID=UPI00261B520C|nr:formate dehydrogenase accessory protein FdhE [Desulfoluna sp.]